MPSARNGRGTHAYGDPAKVQLTRRTLLLLTDAGLALLTKHLQSARSLEPSPSGRGQGEGIPPSPAPSLPPSPRLSVAPSPSLPLAPSPSTSLAPSQILPHYDIDLRELTVAGVVILRLHLQARNLTAVLRAFELAGWPPRVVKPLNGYPDASDPQHLADAVYGLNHHQSLIEFRTDGPAIRWQWRSTQDAHRDAYSANGSSAERSRKRR